MNTTLIKKIELKNTKYSSIFSDNTNIFLVSKLSNTIDKFNVNFELLSHFEFKYDYLDICYSTNNNLFYGLKVDENTNKPSIDTIDTSFKITTSKQLNLNTVPSEITFNDSTNLLYLKVPNKILTLNLKTFKLVSTLDLSDFKNTQYFNNPISFENWLNENKIKHPISQNNHNYRLIDVTSVNNYVYTLSRTSKESETVTTISLLELVDDKVLFILPPSTDNDEHLQSTPNSHEHSTPLNVNVHNEKFKPINNDQKHDFNNSEEYYDFSDFSALDTEDLNYTNQYHEDFDFQDILNSDLHNNCNDIFENHDFADYGLENIINHGYSNFTDDKDFNHYPINHSCDECGDKDWYHKHDCDKFDDNDWHHKHDCDKWDDKNWNHKHDCDKCDDNDWHHKHDCDKCDDNDWHHKHDCDKCDDDDCDHKNDDCKHHNKDCKDNCNEILHSIANVELAIAHILHSEGAKIQKVVKCSNSVCDILEVNNSVIEVIERVTRLEDALCCKLKALKDVCPEKHKCYKKDCFDK